MRKAAFGTAILLLFSISCSAPYMRAPDGSFSKKISFSILEDYEKGTDLKQVEADFKLFRELGINTWRGSISWIDYGPSPGRYDFAWLRQFAGIAKRYDLNLRPYIAYTPEWAARPGGEDKEFWNNPPAHLEEWSDFVHNLATELSRDANVLSFEIYNEENAPMWWDGSPEEYARTLQSGSSALHSTREKEEVLMGGMTYPDTKWVEAVCRARAGREFDILPFHAYPETWTEKNIVVENYLDPAYFREIFVPHADRDCGRKPIWINEMGFATTPGKKTERDQANWWARAIATFVAEPRIEHLGIYEIKEPKRTAEVIGGEENYFLGITYLDGRKKLAFETIKRLMALLNTGTLTVADPAMNVEVIGGTKGELYHHLFIRPDGKQVLFIWDKKESPILKISLPEKGTKITEFGLDGKGKAYKDFDERVISNLKLIPGEVRIFEIE